MASIYGSTNKGWRLRLDWSITGQSIANNTSTLSLALWIYDGSGYSQNESSGEAYYILQGSKSWSPYNYSSTGWYKLGSRSITVSHNADGTKSLALTAEWDCGFDSSYTPRHLSLSETVTLTTIPRASTATVSGDTLGTALTITIKRASGGFTHRLYYSCGQLGKQTIATGVGTSYSWTPPVSLAQQAPNAATVAVALLVETYNGSTYVGASTLQLSLAVPTNVVPSLTVALSDPTNVSTTYGGYVQLRSKLKVALTASGAQGSTIKTYSVKVGSIYAGASATGTTDYLPGAGTLTVTCSVTDSRGRTTTKTQSITVLAYARPTVSAITAARCNANGTANRAGTYGKVTFSGAVTSLSAKNSATYAVQYREVGAEDWTTAGRPAAGEYTPTDVSVVFAADKSKRYEVRVVATDAWESVGSSLRDLPAAYALYHLAKHLLSVGLGRLCDKANAIQVGLSAYFDRDVQIDGTLVVGGATLLDYTHPVGSVYISTAATDPADLFGGGTWERIKDVFLLAAGDTFAAGSTGGEAAHTLTANEMPSHTHNPANQAGYYGFITNSQKAFAIGDMGSQSGNGRYYPYAPADFDISRNTATGATGGGKAHNNMPPYLTVYAWRRTA